MFAAVPRRKVTRGEKWRAGKGRHSGEEFAAGGSRKVGPQLAGTRGNPQRVCQLKGKSGAGGTQRDEPGAAFKMRPDG
ncbi:hypothetical protein NDU88_009878 [Pleurodeles waltl]|uniref:Uncharacterized protein n=1 Tax=Pleurodeles waltl TaxID=8319 RepID=A0AAV7QSU0_PLEWA|nr:hypothetical protein NDU88_009878 [Pleurodeles waltl]